jgi:hypothetical protein
MAKTENTQTENVEETTTAAGAPAVEQQEQALAKKPIVIDEEFVDYILALPGKKKYENSEAGSRNHGMFFRTFHYTDKKGLQHFFNVTESEAFCDDFDKQNLFEVRLVENDLGFYNLAGYKTYTRAERQVAFKEKRELHQVKLTLALGKRASVEEIEDL